jgi:hypothetical protein
MLASYRTKSHVHCHGSFPSSRGPLPAGGDARTGRNGPFHHHAAVPWHPRPRIPARSSPRLRGAARRLPSSGGDACSGNRAGPLAITPACKRGPRIEFSNCLAVTKMKCGSTGGPVHHALDRAGLRGALLPGPTFVPRAPHCVARMQASHLARVGARACACARAACSPALGRGLCPFHPSFRTGRCSVFTAGPPFPACLS